MHDSYEQHIEQFFSIINPFMVEELPVETAPEIQPGTVVRLGERDYIVLASYENGTSALLSRSLISARKFGENANWADSELRQYLNGEFLDELSRAVGAENIVGISRNLITMDGMQKYDSCTDTVSLLSFDDYRAFHDILRDLRVGDWWWLLTPWSGEDGYSRGVCCVYSGGSVCCGVSDCRNGVRPFFLLNSSVLIS